MAESLRAALSGTVEEIIESSVPGEHETALVAITGADQLCTEIPIENTLINSTGEEVHLKAGAKVQVMIRSKAGNHGE
jgi:hypothetical protein